MSDYCQICSPCAEGELCNHMPGPFRKAWKRPRSPFKKTHKWWNMSVWVWPRNQATVISHPQTAIISTPKDKFMEAWRACWLSQWLWGLTLRSTANQLLGLWIWIPLRYGCSSLLFVVCSVGSSLSNERTTHSQKSYCVCVCVCVNFWLKAKVVI